MTEEISKKRIIVGVSMLAVLLAVVLFFVFGQIQHSYNDHVAQRETSAQAEASTQYDPDSAVPAAEAAQ